MGYIREVRGISFHRGDRIGDMDGGRLRPGQYIQIITKAEMSTIGRMNSALQALDISATRRKDAVGIERIRK